MSQALQGVFGKRQKFIQKNGEGEWRKEPNVLFKDKFSKLTIISPTIQHFQYAPFVKTCLLVALLVCDTHHLLKYANRGLMLMDCMIHKQYVLDPSQSSLLIEKHHSLFVVDQRQSHLDAILVLSTMALLFLPHRRQTQHYPYGFALHLLLHHRLLELQFQRRTLFSPSVLKITK